MMQRVTRQNECPVCGKPDWCLVAPDGSAAICQRIDEGSVKRCGEAGSLHMLHENKSHQHRRQRTRRLVIQTKSAAADFAALAGQCHEDIDQQRLQQLGEQLGVSVCSLERLEVGWNGAGVTFPMRNPDGQIIGLRIRYPGGYKACEKGSKQGLFICTGLPKEGLLLICEGPTDTAAALDLGYAAVGRPSCNTGGKMLIQLVSGRPVVLVGDNDTPGRKGAGTLASQLILHCPSVRLLFPPQDIKDLRKWKLTGVTPVQFAAAIEQSHLVNIGESTATIIGKQRHGR